MPVGHCIARLHAKTSFLESAPIHFMADPAGLTEVSDSQLEQLAATWP